MHERLTDKARKVMQLAQMEAQRLNHEYIATEHILLGIIKEGCGVAANVLKNLGLDTLLPLRVTLEKLVQIGPEKVSFGKLPLTRSAKKVIEYSAEEAREFNHSYAGTEHILLGLLREQEGIAAQVLGAHGVTFENTHAELINLLRGSDSRLPPVFNGEMVCLGGVFLIKPAEAAKPADRSLDALFAKVREHILAHNLAVSSVTVMTTEL